MKPPRPTVYLYADGACRGNPGKGGWGYILRDAATGREKRDSGAESNTTNNRMELTSVIRGLESLNRSCRVVLVTDSEYVAKGILEWVAGWKANDWRRKVGRQLKPIKNVDLWRTLSELLERHEVTCEWVPGHSGHPENEECDRMASAACDALG
jgi:ribonuclease HI